MAGVFFSLESDEITTGASALTILQAIAGANHRVHIHEYGMSFKGTSNTAAPILVELIRQTDVGTGGNAVTAQKKNEHDQETIEASGHEDFSTEPAGTNVLKHHLIHPQQGLIWQAPFGQAWVVSDDGSDDQRIGLRVTAGAAVNCVAYFDCEE